MSQKLETTLEKKENIPPKKERIYSPAVDVYENEKEVLLIVDLPGVSEENLDITLEKGVLIIEGKVKSSLHLDYKKEYSESNVDIYKRKFNLGRLLDSDNTTAKLTNGQLRITIPKQEPQKKKIQITTGN